MSIDVLQSKIRKMKNPSVAGLDPRPEHIPPAITERYIRIYGETLRAMAESYWEFCSGLIDALGDIVPAVKPQSAYFEALGWEGVELLSRVTKLARDRGLYVIMDAKRGDIGTTAEAYSAAYLGTVKVGDTEIEPFFCDGITINAYLGSDGIKPFLENCRARQKSAFALVKTSNRSSVEVQDLISGDRVVHLAVGELVERLGKDNIGEYGYSDLGAVVGATFPSDLRKLRKFMDRTFFLVPGYGAQGGSALDVEYAFDSLGRGAIVNSSRAIMCAWKKTGKDGLDYKDAAREEALRMKAEITKYVTIL